MKNIKLFSLILLCFVVSSCAIKTKVYREKNKILDDSGRIIEKSKIKGKLKYTKSKVIKYEYDTITGKILNVNFEHKIYYITGREHNIFYYEKNKKYLNGKKIEVYIEKKKHSSVKFRHFISIKFLPYRKKRLINYIYI
jgi:hypothetical protein